MTNIEGIIDTKEALHKLGQSKELYYKLLTGFLEKYATIDKTIEGLAQRGEFEEARRLTHSIKGLSGNLVSLELQACAKGLEEDLKNELESYTKRLELFSQVHKKVVLEVGLLVEAYKKESLGITEVQGVKKLDYIDASKNLIAALKTNDFSKINDAYKAFRSIQMPLEYQEDVSNINKLIKSYDYMNSVKALQKIIV